MRTSTVRLSLAVLAAAGLATAASVSAQAPGGGRAGAPPAPAAPPDFSKVALDKGIQRLFGLDAVVHFGKSVLKIILVTAIAWLVLKPRMHEFQQMSAMEPTAILPLAVDLFRRLFYAVAGFLLLIAGFDWFWQRQRFMTRMRMTKEELKEDFKQTDGDPHIKARQKQIRMQRSRRRMMAAVPTATVVVMNPTHYAVALKYEPGDKAAPLCVAKGVDSLALKIRAVAEAAGVAVIEDPPLARALYATVEVEAFIPTRHYEAVAKIIGFVMQRARPAQRGT